MTLPFEKYGELEWGGIFMPPGCKTYDYCKRLGTGLIYEIIQEEKTGKLMFITQEECWEARKRKIEFYKTKGIM